MSEVNFSMIHSALETMNRASNDEIGFWLYRISYFDDEDTTDSKYGTYRENVSGMVLGKTIAEVITRLFVHYGHFELIHIECIYNGGVYEFPCDWFFDDIMNTMEE